MALFSKPLVLVVDDYEDARELYVEFLELSGFRVAQARDGAEALELAFELKPDVVLMDLSLPVMDGWEATQRLKADPRTAAIPIVMLTGYALQNESDGLRCESFLLKPCVPEEVIAEVRRVMQRTPPQTRDAPCVKFS